MLLSNFAIRWCLNFLIIYWIFWWYLNRYYSMISIRCYYLVSSIRLSIARTLIINYFQIWTQMHSSTFGGRMNNKNNRFYVIDSRFIKKLETYFMQFAWGLPRILRECRIVCIRWHDGHLKNNYYGEQWQPK